MRFPHMAPKGQAIWVTTQGINPEVALEAMRVYRMVHGLLFGYGVVATAAIETGTVYETAMKVRPAVVAGVPTVITAMMPPAFMNASLSNSPTSI